MSVDEPHPKKLHKYVFLGVRYPLIAVIFAGANSVHQYMTRIYCIIFFAFFSIAARANHLFGGEISYTHVSGNRYRINLSLYGDCGSDNPTAFLSLPNAYPTILILNNGIQTDSMHLTPNGSEETDVTPVCIQEQGNSRCVNPSSTLPGIKKFTYSKEYTLPSVSAGWSFVFNGELNNGSVAGRSSSISNVQNVANQFMYLVATLNNMNGPNSSPGFTSIPTPFYCINLAQQYNQGAVDADGDSLAYSLTPALVNGAPVNYNFPYSEDMPFSAAPSSFSFNPLNGQISFIPNTVQNALVVNKVTEYKNGVVTGSCMRELSFIILDDCQNTPPSIDVAQISLNGGVRTTEGVINVCEGASSVEFTLPFEDEDGDTLEIVTTPGPAGAVINIQNNNTAHPELKVSWNISTVPAGVYSFFATIKDKHCPLSSEQTFAITIRIISGVKMTTTLLEPTNCLHEGVVSFDLEHGALPRVITLRQNGSIVTTYLDSTGHFTDSLSAGNYDAEVSSPNMDCSALFSFEVPHSGTFPLTPVVERSILCTGETSAPLKAIPFNGATVTWYDETGMQLPDAPVPNTSVPGHYRWLIRQQYLVCSSEMDTVDVYVAPQPEIHILNEAGASQCLGDKVYLRATGAATIAWKPEELLFYEPDSTMFIRVMQPNTYTAVGTNEYGCTDSSTISFTDIQPCCTFSFPDAFTPNNDGRNDSWRPLTYGNQSAYELSIYNRWGQRLFHSFTPNEGWQGYFNGRLQETGTYFYVFRARCMTGQTEERQGTIMLIR